MPLLVLAGPPFAHSYLPLQSDEVRHEGGPIALVLGDTLELAEAGVRKVNVRYPNYQVRPQYLIEKELTARFGREYANWVVRRTRNLELYPNLILMDTISSQLRVTYPVSVNKTLVETFCIAPVGESATARNARIRQYEDFYNASGTATPDDLVEFGYMQMGFEARNVEWTDLSRGMGNYIEGPNQFAKEIGALPKTSSANECGSELLYVEINSNWLNRMIEGINRELETI